jgi:hypothetical protein
MSSPYVRVNSERQIIGVSSDEAVRRSSSEIQDRVVSGSNASKNPSSVIADEAFGTPVPVGGGVTGVIDITDDTDFYTVSLVAGQTYSFSMRGAGTRRSTIRCWFCILPQGLSSSMTMTAATASTRS